MSLSLNLKWFVLVEDLTEYVLVFNNQFMNFSITANDWNHERKSAPMLFTVNGVAMLSIVLNCERAIEVNISIMRTFNKLRSFLKKVFERLDTLQGQITPKLPANRKNIGPEQDQKYTGS